MSHFLAPKTRTSTLSDQENPMKKAALWEVIEEIDEFYIYNRQSIFLVEVMCLESFQVEKTFKSRNDVELEHLEFVN